MASHLLLVCHTIHSDYHTKSKYNINTTIVIFNNNTTYPNTKIKENFIYQYLKHQ